VTLCLKNHTTFRRNKRMNYNLQFVPFDNFKPVRDIKIYQHLLTLNFCKYLNNIRSFRIELEPTNDIHIINNLLFNYKVLLNFTYLKMIDSSKRTLNPSQYIFSVGNYLCHTYKNNQMTPRGSKGTITNNNTTYYYLEYYFSLLLHNNILKKINKNKVLGLYPVTSSHFVKGTSFSSSLENVVKFRRFFFKNKISNLLNQPVPSLLLTKLSVSLKTKFFFQRNIYIFRFYKDKLKLNVVKYIKMITLFLVKYKLKNYNKYRFLKFFFKKNLTKIYYKGIRNINKKSRYLRFVSKIKGFSKNFKSNVVIRTKKL
jgi:hypothetical protein